MIAQTRSYAREIVEISIASAARNARSENAEKWRKRARSAAFVLPWRRVRETRRRHEVDENGRESICCTCRREKMHCAHVSAITIPLAIPATRRACQLQGSDVDRVDLVVICRGEADENDSTVMYGEFRW